MSKIVLLCERINQETNEYVELLTKTYQEHQWTVVLDVQNFLYSSIDPEFVHIQWPEAIYRWRHAISQDNSGLDLVQRRLHHFKQRGVPIVYTMHNTLPHGSVDRFDAEVYKAIALSADIVVHHGESSISQFLDEHPECVQAEHIVCPHGPYTAEFSEPASCRGKYRLHCSRFVYLNFGLQKKYKGRAFTMRVFDRWNNRHHCLFTIGKRSGYSNSGSFCRKAFREISWMLGDLRNAVERRLSRRRKTFLRTVPQTEIPTIMGATDVVFLGHQSGLNSGILSLATSYGKPVVFPDLGNFREQLDGWDWWESYAPGNESSALEALNRMQERLADYPPGKVVFDNTEWRERNSWNTHVQRILESVESLLKERGKRTS